jgi:peptide chain release factor subunit 1
MSTIWESIEERERRVRGTRTTSAMVHASEQIPAGDTLKESFAQRPFISREDLRNIARRQYEGPVTTLYLNFAPPRLARDDRPILSVFHSLRHGSLEARKPYLESLPHTQRLRVPEDLDDIQKFLEGFEPEGARALVIFKSGAPLNRAVPLPVRVADSLTIETDPYVEPLEAIMEEQHRVLVVHVSMEKTFVSIYQLGYEEGIESIKSDLPTGATESRPGKDERHRMTHVLWHFKASARLAERVFRERGCDLVAVMGVESVVKDFEDYLPKSLHDRLVARIHLSPDAGPSQRREALEGALAQQRKKDEEVALEELGFYQGHDRLAAGLEEVLDAANLFLMRRLFLDHDLERAGYVCRNHHFLSLTSGSCPFDNQALLPAGNVIDELVEVARLHGVELMLVRQRPDLLRPYAGVAAILVTAAPLHELRRVKTPAPTLPQR